MPASLLLITLVLSSQAGGHAGTPAADRPAILQQINAADNAAARKLIAADRDTTRAALDDLIATFDRSIHSDRRRPEQRLVQYDAEGLTLGLRVSDLYAKVTGDNRYWRRFEARRVRMEGTKLLNARKYRDAIGQLSRALNEAEALDDRWLQTITRVNLAYGYLESGEKEKALAECERANELAATMDARARGLTLFNLASMHGHLGNYEQSIPYARAAIEASREVGIKIWEGNGELNLGATYQMLGRPAEAQAAFERALAVLTTTGDHLGVGRSLYNLALVCGDQGRHAEAAAHMERALPIIREVDIRHSHEIELDAAEYQNPLEASAHQVLITWYGKLGQPGKVAEHQKALEQLRSKKPKAPAHTHKPGDK